MNSFRSRGDSAYFTVELQGQVRLCDLLTHLYVLVPVLDDEKHYWVEMTKSTNCSATAAPGSRVTQSANRSCSATCGTSTA